MNKSVEKSKHKVKPIRSKWDLNRRTIQNSYSKSALLSRFCPERSQDWEDSRLLFLYLIDKLPVFNPDFRAAAKAFL
jgi:hypothetical protein